MKKKEEVYPVEICVEKKLGKILSNFDIYNLKETNTHYYAIINLYKYEFALSEIKEIIGVCEIIKPNKLRVFAKKTLEEQLRKY